MSDLSAQQVRLISWAEPTAKLYLEREAEAGYNGHTLSRDVVAEAIRAWERHGIHKDYSTKEIQWIAQAIVGQVSAVLLMNGWTAPELPKAGAA
jgi:hypothetical protein